MIFLNLYNCRRNYFSSAFIKLSMTSTGTVNADAAAVDAQVVVAALAPDLVGVILVVAGAILIDLADELLS